MDRQTDKQHDGNSILDRKFRKKCKHQMLPLSPSVTLEKDSPEAKGLGFSVVYPIKSYLISNALTQAVVVSKVARLAARGFPTLLCTLSICFIRKIF